MTPTRDQLLAKLQHAEGMRDAAQRELEDIERQPAPSRYDLIVARKASELALSELEDIELQLFSQARRTA